MVFTSRNNSVPDIDIRIFSVPIEGVYVTRFLGILIDFQLNWKQHIWYTNKQLWKCIRILSKATTKIHKPSPITLYYSFAYPHMIYCNQVWGNNYPTSINKYVLIQKKIVRISICYPNMASTEPLIYANKILSLTDINIYILLEHLCISAFTKKYHRTWSNCVKFPANSSKKYSDCTHLQTTISQLFDWKISLCYNHYKTENDFLVFYDCAYW